jgi:hypothetical protein
MTNDEAVQGDYVWQVTKEEEGGINVAFGPKLSEAGYNDDTKLHVLGKALIQLGTQLMGSTVSDDDDEWDDED